MVIAVNVEDLSALDTEDTLQRQMMSVHDRFELLVCISIGSRPLTQKGYTRSGLMRKGGKVSSVNARDNGSLGEAKKQLR